jgi:hypothetical protein
MATQSKRKPRKAARKLAAVVAPARSVAPATGPVTLAEARALVQAQRPPQALRPLEKGAAPKPSPATVGAERQRLEKERKQEIAQRVRDYKATMAIMKKRGARRPQPKGAPKVPEVEPAAAPSFAPLQVLAEGDSWFDYPVPFFGGGIIPRLETRLGVPILNLAKAGDEVRYMLGVEERELLAKHLEDGCPAGGAWDVLLFSGGGNDIVDNPMALWIRDFNPALSPADHIHQARFAAALELVRAGYEDLIAVRDALSPDTHLVFQGYDFAIPDGRGICHLGPWLKPTFDLRNFPSQAAAFEVVKEMLRQFAALLTSLAAAPRVTFINGQGTLPQQKSSWHNELHPSRAGFDRFADLFHATLRALFPNRVV